MADENQGALTGGVPLKVTGSTTKGGLATVQAPTGVLMDANSSAGILQNMEKLAAQIQDPWRQMQEGLKDMSAWTHYNKTPAFMERAESAANDRNTLYSLRQQQAAMQAAQMQAQAENARINRMMGVGADGQPAGKSTLPPNVIASLNAVNPNDVAAKQAILNNYFKTDVTEATKMGYNPASFVTKQTFVPQVGEDLDMTPPEVKEYIATGKIPDRFKGGVSTGSGTVPSGAPTVPTGTPTSASVGPQVATPGAALQAANAANIPNILSADRDFAKQSQLKAASLQPGYAGPPVAAPGTSQHEFGRAIDVDMKKAPPGTREKLIAAGFVQPLPKTDPNHWELPRAATSAPEVKPVPVEKTLTAGESVVPTPAATTAPTTTAPTVPALPEQKAAVKLSSETGGFVPPYPRPINSAQAEANRKAKEEYNKTILGVSGKEAETAAGESGKAYAQMNKLAEAAELNTIPAAQSVIDIATDPKRNRVLAYLQGGDKTATALYTVSKHLSNKTPEQLQEEIITNKFTPQELNDYRTVQNSAQKLGIDFAADVFKGARMGIGLEKMAMGAKGIGADLPPELNAKNAQLIRDAGQFQVDKKNMFTEWAKTHGGRLASFDEFEGSPEYVKFRNEAKQKFLNTYKGIVKEVKQGEESSSELSPAERARQELENRKKGSK